MSDRRPAVISAVTVVLGICLALWLSGCSSSATDSEEPSVATTPSDPALVAEIQQAADATKALTSAHLSISSTGRVESLLGISSADVDVRANPLAAKGVCTYNDEAGVPFRVADDQISVKLFDDWTTLGSLSELASARLVDPTNGVAKMLSGVTNLRSDGTEVIDGVPTNQITGMLSTDTVKMLDPGARQPRPATVWIANDGSHRLVRAQVDLGSGTVAVTLSKWNEPVDID